ncbi:glycosyltransferase, partial [Bradyrhizobium sp.]|uniref:glycosyltransferase n=1 Tax=Bradyrhizobium sp. TaxID=376 RepID=UPI003C7178A5
MKISSSDIVIVGPLLNNDVVMAEALTYNGFDCVVVRDAVTGRPDARKFPGPLKHFSLDRVVVVGNSFEFFRICRNARCVISYSGAVTWLLRYFWFIARILGFPPIINVPTGSDITELAVERSRAGWLYRDMLRCAAFTVIPTYPRALKVLAKLKLERFTFFKYPYLLPDDLIADPLKTDVGEKIVFLHVSNLDWGASDNKRGRNSTKGNDRFLRAFASAARAGAPIECHILDRGPDRFLARQLVSNLDAEFAFRWLEPVPSSELTKLLAGADVVVDQFDVGGFGAISLEAMAVGKPVMMHVDATCAGLIYKNEPPILNCSSEKQILAMIFGNLDRASLRSLG